MNLKVLVLPARKKTTTVVKTYNIVVLCADGNRIFWNVGVQVEVVDLTSRKVTESFDSPQITGGNNPFRPMIRGLDGGR